MADIHFTMEDKGLQASLLADLEDLERKIDCVGETPIRQKLSALLVLMRKAVKNGQTGTGY